MRTAWGYDVSVDSIAPIISVELFNELTGNKFEDELRAEAAIKAASQAIRNHCGWHITPALSCTATPTGGAGVLKLPAGYVSTLSGIEENGVAIEAYEWRKDGLIRRTDCRKWSDKWDGITVNYTAGYEAEAVPDLVEAVCSIASGVMSVAPGVVSESADGVAVSYSANAASIAASLTSQMKSALEPYKLVSSHAV